MTRSTRGPDERGSSLPLAAGCSAPPCPGMPPRCAGHSCRSSGSGPPAHLPALVLPLFCPHPVLPCLSCTAWSRVPVGVPWKRVLQVYLEGGGLVYTCSTCRAHLATRDHVVSEVSPPPTASARRGGGRGTYLASSLCSLPFLPGTPVGDPPG